MESSDYTELVARLFDRVRALVAEFKALGLIASEGE